jgi:hypothetical protein
MYAMSALTIIMGLIFLSSTAIGQGAGRPNTKKDDYVVTDSTKIDFEGANVDGKMKAPTGFFLQGRNSQSLSQMVKLRSDFKKELKGSRDSVRALVR